MGPSSLPLGVLVVAGLAAAYFLLIPLLVLASQRFRADVNIVAFDPAATPPPPSLVDFFRGTNVALVELGFRRLGSFVLPDAMPNVQGVLQFYVNEDTRDAALVTALYGTAANAPAAIQLRYTEFLSRFSSPDVRIVQTNNTDNIGSFKPLPTDLTFRFPQIEYLVTLYRLHQALVQRHAGGRQKTLRVMEEYRGDAVAYLRDVAFLESYQEQEATGYLRYNAAGECWRPTFKGVYLMTWRELWPIKQFIRAHVRRNARRLERDLGIGPEVV